MKRITFTEEVIQYNCMTFQWQVTNATGSAAIFPSIHNRVYALGCEIGVSIPKLRSHIVGWIKTIV